MAKRALHWLVALGTGAAFTACGGSNGATPTTRMPSTNAVTTVPVTEAATTEPTAAPTTTLPPTLNLAELPGLLAIDAKSCAPDAFPDYTNVPESVICTMRPDGSDVKIVSAPGDAPSGPMFTRDGAHIYYTELHTTYGRIYNLSTGENRERVFGETLRRGVSPDSQWILAFDAELNGLTISNIDLSAFPDGSLSRLVAADPLVDSSGTWAPDSIHFAWLSRNDGAGGELECPEVWVGAIDGTPPVQITHFLDEPDGAVGCPANVRWAPVGDKLLMHMLGKPMYVAENQYVINSDGTGLTALTHSEPVLDPNGSTYQDEGSSYSGDWSPDGKYIALIMGDGSAYHLYVINAEGGQRTEIAAAPLGITTSLVGLRWSLG